MNTQAVVLPESQTSLHYCICSMTARFTLTEAAEPTEHKPPAQVTSTVNTAPLDKPETGEWLSMHIQTVCMCVCVHNISSAVTSIL